MNAQALFAILGSTLLGLGVFLPVINLPFGATQDYFGEADRDGVFVLIGGGFALLCALFRRYHAAAVLAG